MSGRSIIKNFMNFTSAVYSKHSLEEFSFCTVLKTPAEPGLLNRRKYHGF